MSEAMKKLIEVLQKDESKLSNFKACQSAAEQSKLANELGFNIPAEEFEKLNQNLSDEQLDQVAGGSCGFNIFVG